MTLEIFVEQVRQAIPTGLQSVILYGSAAAGDHLGKQSDYNILIVLERLGVPELTALAAPTQAWVKRGNHPPMLFTPDSLRESGVTFPIELLDIRDAHKVLFGDDVLAGIPISQVNLRRQVEHELHGKLLQLQSQFLLTAAQPKRIVELLTGTLSKFLILFRAALRLYQPDVPVKKLEALEALSRYIAFEVNVFVTIQELKDGRQKSGTVEPEVLFAGYTAAIQTIVKTISNLEKGTDK